METKFTKGEWILFEDAPFQEVQCREGDNLMSVNIFYYRNFGIGTEGDPISDNFSEASVANAKLIAAAPEIFEAIKYYFDVLKEVRGENWDKNPDHVLSKMINAIKKATE